jgi:hypothetical protein
MDAFFGATHSSFIQRGLTESLKPSFCVRYDVPVAVSRLRAMKASVLRDAATV